jgi:hypothetical protein
MGSKAREAAESEFMGALKHCVRDGRLDDNEILELMSTARASGLAANDEEARAYVQDKYQSLMAGG